MVVSPLTRPTSASGSGILAEETQGRETGERGERGQDSGAGVVTLLDVLAAARRIAPYIQRTPLERSGHLSDALGPRSGSSWSASRRQARSSCAGP